MRNGDRNRHGIRAVPSQRLAFAAPFAQSRSRQWLGEGFFLSAHSPQNDVTVVDVTPEDRGSDKPIGSTADEDAAFLSDMATHVQELKAAVRISLQELSRTAAALAPEIGLEQALLLK